VNTAVFINDPDGLEIRFPAALGNTGDILTDTAFTFRFASAYYPVADLGTLAAIFTYS